MRAIGYWLLAIGYWLAAAPGCVHAQGLPAYAPINPIASSRSGLATQPYLEPGRRWHWSVQTDYASMIEYADLGDRSYFFDAEVLRQQLGVVRSAGKAFFLAEASFNSAYAGFMDPFFDWYHNFTGLRVKAREVRPTNAFAYDINLVDGTSFSYRPASGFLGDLRLGAGLRHSRHWQSMLSFTLPTGSGPEGYRRGGVSANATTTLWSGFCGRCAYEGTLSAGYTPRHGDLAERQHNLFVMVTQGLRVRLTGALHAYGNLIYHSAYYRDTGMKGLDNRELTVDLGGMLRFKRGPEWHFGVTEDLEPKGPAVDLSFRLAARW